LSKKWAVFAAAVAALVAAVAAAAAMSGDSQAQSATAMPHKHTVVTATSASTLRVNLNRLLGEHALLAVDATRSGLTGNPDFKAVAASLDRNSVQIANAIGSVYGRKARNTFLNGSFLWRDHVKFFVDYTVALAKNDMAGQKKAVANLQAYTAKQAVFLAGATGLPASALRMSLLEHVLQLKGSLDAYKAKNYARSERLAREAYHHMGMTADTLAAAIVKKFPAKFKS
jgi:hypothetical protein